jgi:CheY-like chemotaxis protein
MDAPFVGDGKLALVIDDNSDFLLAMEQLLGALGFGIAKAHNGAEGLSWLHRATPDVILLDLFMPVLDGMDFVRYAHTTARAVPPIIAVTGDQHLGRDVAATAIEQLGAKVILLKPFTGEQLRAALAHVLRPVAPAEPDEAEE